MKCEENHVLMGFNTKKFRKVNTQERCIMLCVEEEKFRCQSLDYNKKDKKCLLSTESKYTRPKAMRNNTKYNYCSKG